MAQSTTRIPKKAYTGLRYTFSHADLGDLTGRLVKSQHFPDHPIVQFRSIPFATVPKRFFPSTLLTEIPSDVDDRPHRDFTNFGAACPQIGGASSSWADPYGGWLEDELDLEFDEFTCLTVTVSVPQFRLDENDNGRELPVMVYVHGKQFLLQPIVS
jgi:carboxylesterase type B